MKAIFNHAELIAIAEAIDVDPREMRFFDSVREIKGLLRNILGPHAKKYDLGKIIDGAFGLYIPNNDFVQVLGVGDYFAVIEASRIKES